MPSVSRSAPQSPIPRSRTSSVLPPVNSQPPATKSKAQLLREYRARHGRPQISEALLLRDALYLLQGISGKVVRFVENKTGGELTVVFSEDPVSGRPEVVTFSDYLQRFLLPAPTRALILRLSELGHLYVRVSKWVRDHDGRPGVGMIEQVCTLSTARNNADFFFLRVSATIYNRS